MNTSSLKTVSVALLVCIAPALMAHPGHGESGFASGAAHPIAGLDHLLAMVAVGLLGVRIGGRALWALPASFMACMGLGGLLAAFGGHLPMAEWGIALSVLVFGVLIALANAPRFWIAALVVGSFAVLHGFAHVSEMGAGQSLTGYCSGFLLTTAMFHAAGIGGALAIKRFATTAWLRGAGVAVALASLMLFVQVAHGD